MRPSKRIEIESTIGRFGWNSLSPEQMSEYLEYINQMSKKSSYATVFETEPSTSELRIESIWNIDPQVHDSATHPIPSPPAPSAKMEPGEEMETNENGGVQTKSGTRYDLLDGHALKRMATVLHYGAVKYTDENWRAIDLDSHLDHALAHIFDYLQKRRENPYGSDRDRVPFTADGKDDDLAHAAVRLVFALAVEMQKPEWPEMIKEDPTL